MQNVLKKIKYAHGNGFCGVKHILHKELISHTRYIRRVYLV